MNGAKDAKYSHFSPEEIEKITARVDSRTKEEKKKMAAKKEQLLSAEDYLKMASEHQKKFEETHDTKYLDLAKAYRKEAEKMEKEETK